MNNTTLTQQLTQQLTDKEVGKALGISRMSVWRWAKAGRLPQPRKLGGNTTRWDSAEVQAAIHKTAV